MRGGARHGWPEEDALRISKTIALLAVTSICGCMTAPHRYSSNKSQQQLDNDYQECSARAGAFIADPPPEGAAMHPVAVLVGLLSLGAQAKLADGALQDCMRVRGYTLAK